MASGTPPTDGADASDSSTVTAPGLRWPMSLVSLGIVVFLLGLGAWWAQDAAAPFRNVGEADIPGTVTFDATAGRYRVVTSGPSRPEIDRTACDVVLADGAELRILAGEGSVATQQHFGVSRVIEFEAVDGPTTVSCEDRIAPSVEGGRFAVVGADRIVGIIVGAGVACFLVGVAWTALRARRAASDTPAAGPPPAPTAPGP